MRLWCWDMKRRGRGSRRTGKKSHTWRSRLHWNRVSRIRTAAPRPSVFTISIRSYVLEAWSYAARLPNNLTNRRHIAALGSGGTSRAKASKFWEAAQRPVINREKRLTRIVLFLLEDGV